MEGIMRNNKHGFDGLIKYLEKYQNILLFSVFAIGYFLWRYIGFNYLVWDDTSSASYNIFINNTYYSLSKEGFISWMLNDVFANIQGDGYRPFMAFAKRIGLGYFTDPSKTTIFWVLCHSIAIGLFVVVYYNFSKKFVQTRIMAMFAVLLLVFSTPFLSAGLIVYSGFHCIIPIIICSGFFCYYKLVEQRKFKFFWTAGLFLIMMCGPLFREYLSIFPLLIIFLEFQRSRRVTWIVGMSAFSFLHALFPTAIVKLLIFNDIPIRPVFAMGNLGAYLQVGTGDSSLLDIISHLHWRIFIDIISIYPPSVFVLALLAFILKSRMYKDRAVVGRDTIFLMVFFFISFLPFLKAFNEQVHLTYCMVPLSILLAKAIEYLWFMIRQSKKAVNISKGAFVVLLTMILMDQSLNVYAVRKVTRDMYQGITTAASWFVENVPQGTPVITNAHHLEDIRFYSNGHIEPWGAPGGIPDQRKWMHDVADLQNLLDASKQKGRDVYFFDVEIRETPGQRGLGRRLFYVRDQNVEMEDLGILYTIKPRYLFLDPLKHLIPMGQITWPGPPDLEFDFYRGPALDGMPFHREVYARYHLYKATGDKVVGNTGFPQLVEENFHGFNLVSYHGRIYAIPQPEGAFELERVRKKDYSQSFEGATVAQVQEEIRQFFVEKQPIVPEANEPKHLESANRKMAPPQLVEENFHGFNLVSYHGRIYAIPQPEGAFELERVRKKDYSQSFEGATVAQVQEEIRQFFVEKQPIVLETVNVLPRLIEENYRGFNIISLQGQIYAVLQVEGQFNLKSFKNGEYSPSFVGNSVVQVKNAVDDARSSVWLSFKIFCRHTIHALWNFFK
jgi:hypothetical protein